MAEIEVLALVRTRNLAGTEARGKNESHAEWGRIALRKPRSSVRALSLGMLGSLALACSSTCVAAQTRPNILVIFGDDVG